MPLRFGLVKGGSPEFPRLLFKYRQDREAALAGGVMSVIARVGLITPGMESCDI